MKKKILLSVCFILIGCFLGTTIGELKYRNMNEKKEYSEEILLEYGDKFPLDKFKKLEKDNKENEDIYNIILYVDPYCDSCIENYIVVERMYKILSKEKIGVKIIWKQKPKEKAIDNIDVPKENQYMVRNTNLLNEYPLFFITDKNSKVLMMTDNISKVMKKILELEEINRDYSNFCKIPTNSCSVFCPINICSFSFKIKKLGYQSIPYIDIKKSPLSTNSFSPYESLVYIV